MNKIGPVSEWATRNGRVIWKSSERIRKAEESMAGTKNWSVSGRAPRRGEKEKSFDQLKRASRQVSGESPLEKIKEEMI